MGGPPLGAVRKVRHAILANFYPLPLSHFVTHPWTPPPKVRHTSRTPPDFLVGLVQKARTKAPCTNSLSIVRGDFCPGGFVRGGFCPFPLLSEYICYNRKVNITLNFMFHMYDLKKFISVTSHALNPLPLSQTVTPSRTPTPKA